MSYRMATEKVREFALNFFHSNANPRIFYHDISHTKSVVNSATKLAKIYHLDDRDTFIVVAASWFHDAGYFSGAAEGHELRGADIASALLKNMHQEDSVIDGVRNCILATKMPQQPKTLLEQIVCDADLAHLATDDFFERNKLLRKEIEATTVKKISKTEWRKNSLLFLEKHSFKTDYGKTEMTAGKQKNIEKLKARIKTDDQVDLSKNTAINTTSPNRINEPATTPVQIEENQSKRKKKDRPDRGIETMFRISSSNHQRLSDMADNKAHIMITTTSIIMSVVLSVLLRKLEDNTYLTIPVVMLLVICVITMVFCILATRPSIPHGTFTQKDIDDKTVNLLFFGNFYRMSLEEYSAGVQKMMNDRDFLYGTLTRDIYAQGVILGRKYNLLRVGYSIFMFGIIASVLAFIIATIFYS